MSVLKLTLAINWDSVQNEMSEGLVHSSKKIRRKNIVILRLGSRICNTYTSDNQET